jgi:eukaryotic-like serine/threonine-protein kinase
VQTSQLTWRARDGTVIGRIGAPGGYTDLTLAPDEQRIAVSRIDPGKQSAIWVVDVSRGTALKMSFDPVSLGPAWSPDSAAVAYGSARDGPPSLFQKFVSGSGQDVLLFKSHRSSVPTDWCVQPSPARTRPGFGGQAQPSPVRTGPGFGGQAPASPERTGGALIFVAVDAKTQSDVWMLPPAGEPQPVPLLQGPFNEDDARCSPDGRWLAYSSDETGRQEIYVTSFPKPGGKWPVSTSGGTQPRWRRDGTELFYVAPDGTLTSVRVGTGSTFEAGAAAPLFQIRGSSYAPSADGRRFVTNDPVGEPTAQPINVVLNWTAGLRN